LQHERRTLPSRAGCGDRRGARRSLADRGGQGRRDGSADAHAILILDQAGRHGARKLRIPANISLLPLPPRSPELNSQENIWQFMHQNWLSNRVFKSFDDIVDQCCYTWNTLIDQSWKIMSVARREWAAVGH
jgi:hypothetical protein